MHVGSQVPHAHWYTYGLHATTPTALVRVVSVLDLAQRATQPNAADRNTTQEHRVQGSGLQMLGLGVGVELHVPASSSLCHQGLEQ